MTVLPLEQWGVELEMLSFPRFEGNFTLFIDTTRQIPETLYFSLSIVFLFPSSLDNDIFALTCHQ